MLRALRDAQLWRLSHTELLDAGRLLESIARTVYAAQIRFAGEVDDTALADQLSVSSTRVLLRNTLRISSGDAAARVRAAKLLLWSEPITGGQIPAALPQVAAALDDGAIGEGHVSVITQAVKAWPKTLDADVWTSAEQLLVDTARDCDPGEVSKVAQHLANMLDPDGNEPDDAEPECRMELHLGRRNPRTGLIPLNGMLDDETVEAFRQATDPLAAPTPRSTASRTPARPRCGRRRRTSPRSAATSTPGRTHRRRALPHMTMARPTTRSPRASRTPRSTSADPSPPPPPGASPATRPSCRSWSAGTSQVHRRRPRATAVHPRPAQRPHPPRPGLRLAGCTRPTGWTQAHHILSWLDGGPTDIDNGCRACQNLCVSACGPTLNR